MVEPQNSWEISFVLDYMRPDIHIGIPERFLWNTTLRAERLKELIEWSKTPAFNKVWIKDHVDIHPYAKKTNV